VGGLLKFAHVHSVDRNSSKLRIIKKIGNCASGNPMGEFTVLILRTRRSVPIFAVATAVVYWKFAREKARWWTTSLIILTAAMVAVTGHLGGTLVHGSLFAP